MKVITHLLIASVLSLFLSAVQPARASVILDPGTSDWLSTVTLPASALPFFVVLWFRADDVTGTYAMFSLQDKDSTDLNIGLTLQAAGTIANDPVRTLAGTGNIATTTTGYTASTWFHAAGFWKSTTDRRAYINGGSANTNTGSFTMGAIDRLGIGGHADSTPSAFFDGKIAHVAFYDATGLADADVTTAIADLAAGRNPLAIQPTKLLAYWPLLSNPNDTKGSNHLTENGTITYDGADNPTVDNPPSNQSQGVMLLQ